MSCLQVTALRAGTVQGCHQKGNLRHLSMWQTLPTVYVLLQIILAGNAGPEHSVLKALLTQLTVPRACIVMWVLIYMGLYIFYVIDSYFVLFVLCVCCVDECHSTLFCADKGDKPWISHCTQIELYIYIAHCWFNWIKNWCRHHLIFSVFWKQYCHIIKSMLISFFRNMEWHYHKVIVTKDTTALEVLSHPQR